VSERATAVLDIPAPQVSRLRCQGCATRACEQLSSIPGVIKVDCGDSSSSVDVEFDPQRISEADLLSMLERYGMTLSELHHHAAWRITGLD
jgi:copper chaperone CopZ